MLEPYVSLGMAVFTKPRRCASWLKPGQAMSPQGEGHVTIGMTNVLPGDARLEYTPRRVLPQADPMTSPCLLRKTTTPANGSAGTDETHAYMHPYASTSVPWDGLLPIP